MQELFTDFAKDRILESLQRFFQGHHRFKWDADSKNSSIMIVDKYGVNLDSVTSENKPAIVVNRGPMAWRNRTIDQFKAHRGDPNYRKEYLDLIDTSLVLSCVSRNGLEAEFIASLVFGFFQFFKEEIRKQRRIHDVRSNQIGTEQLGKSDSDTELVLVPVTITLSMNQSWSTEEVGAAQLQSICLSPDIFNEAATKAKEWNNFQQSLINI